MTTDQGSDERFAELADTAAIAAGARRRRASALPEEWRVRAQPATGDPGADHPDPDVAPPADEPHPEFDPTPPA